MENYKSWIGHTQTIEDIIDLQTVNKLASTLNIKEKFKEGEPLPYLWHWIFFLDICDLDETGRDGHPKKGGFLPPIELPKRMWAGGRFLFEGTLKIGEKAKKRSIIKNIVFKQGNQGKLCFVTIEHIITSQSKGRWIEEHDIVYKEDTVGSFDIPTLTTNIQADESIIIYPSSTLLFRYSALTFNGHKIHYDKVYCNDVENYPDLVVHGPLCATFLVNLCLTKSPKRLKKFEYRALKPAFVDNKLEFCYTKDKDGSFDLWTKDHLGQKTMQAKGEFYETSK